MCRLRVKVILYLSSVRYHPAASAHQNGGDVIKGRPHARAGLKATMQLPHEMKLSRGPGEEFLDVRVCLSNVFFKVLLR